MKNNLINITTKMKGEHNMKKLNVKTVETACPPLETLPNKNNPVDCFCERKPKSLISRRGNVANPRPLAGSAGGC